jgi:hypothetical protein
LLGKLEVKRKLGGQTLDGKIILKLVTVTNFGMWHKWGRRGTHIIGGKARGKETTRKTKT